uniref:ATP synthase complex subunit 8 n=1 Tax=Triacanthus biaculeatus TaxID=384595 RepID=A4QJ35_TRIBT|nr:ATP synthase F0 subunit 8 [Triacanthus biaculeatus]BAF51898.1 ATPase subunit 8 [Triacanthus biaculeatus]
MPQLNPDPWFMILTFSWLVFGMVFPQKVLSHTFPNEPVQRSTDTVKTATWTWPWQ